PANQAPEILNKEDNSHTWTFTEDRGDGAKDVYMLAVEDDSDNIASEGGGLSFSLTKSDDQKFFGITSDGLLKVRNEIVYNEVGGNSYEIEVVVSDSNGLTDSNSYTVEILPPVVANEAPVILNKDENSFVHVATGEDGTARIVFVVEVEDDNDAIASEGGGLDFQLTKSDDQKLLGIGENGVVRFREPIAYIPEGDNTYEIEVTVTDSGNLSDSNIYTIEVVPPTVNFSVTSFTLIDAATNQPLFDIMPGQEIVFGEDINTLFLDIRANTTDDVESVRLSLTGAQESGRVESLLPYALFQDLPVGDYTGNDFAFGAYTVSAVPFSLDGANGAEGAPFSVDFSIVMADVPNEAPVIQDRDNNSFTFEATGETGDGVRIVFNVPVMDDSDSVNDGLIFSQGDTPDKPFFGVGQLGNVLIDADVRYQEGGDNEYEIVIIVEDSEGLMDMNTYFIEVLPPPVNQAPVITNATDDVIDFYLPLPDPDQEVDGERIVYTVEVEDDRDSVGNGLLFSQDKASSTDQTVFGIGQQGNILVGKAIVEDPDTYAGRTYDMAVLVEDFDGGVASHIFKIRLLAPKEELSVTSFTLIDASTNQPLFDIMPGQEIVFGEDINTLFLDIRANTTEDVESVRLSLTGAQESGRVESLLPYALFQDLPVGDYTGNDFAFGAYTVSAVPFSLDGANGMEGEMFSVSFSILPEPNNLVIAPNPVAVTAMISYEKPNEVNTVQVFDLQGRMVQSHDNIGSDAVFEMDVQSLSPGLYIVRTIDTNGQSHSQQMVINR
ncbi:MAG: T9SS type A sorting domain-containing protein, partial [Bacteroidota bacterium]